MVIGLWEWNLEINGVGAAARAFEGIEHVVNMLGGEGVVEGREVVKTQSNKAKKNSERSGTRIKILMPKK